MSEERCVWLAQCVCPYGHTIMVYANEAAGLKEAKQDVIEPLVQKIMGCLNDHSIEPTCAICEAKADTWRFCVARTPFLTMAEAHPHLMEARMREMEMQRREDMRQEFLRIRSQ